MGTRTEAFRVYSVTCVSRICGNGKIYSLLYS